MGQANTKFDTFFSSLFDDDAELKFILGLLSESEEKSTLSLTKKQWKQLIFVSTIENSVCLLRFGCWKLPCTRLFELVWKFAVKLENPGLTRQIMVDGFNEALTILHRKNFLINAAADAADDDDDSVGADVGNDDDDIWDDDDDIWDSGETTTFYPGNDTLQLSTLFTVDRTYEVHFEGKTSKMFNTVVREVIALVNSREMESNEQYETELVRILDIVSKYGCITEMFHDLKKGLRLDFDTLVSRCDAYEEEEVQQELDFLVETGVAIETRFDDYHIQPQMQFPFPGECTNCKRFIRPGSDTDEICVAVDCRGGGSCGARNWYHPGCFNVRKFTDPFRSGEQPYQIKLGCCGHIQVIEEYS